MNLIMHMFVLGLQPQQAQVDAAVVGGENLRELLI